MASTIFSSSGLNVNMYEPPWRGSTWVSSLTDDIKSYGHDIAAIGGFTGANITLFKQPGEVLEDWVENGLGREIKVKAGSGATAFEGFINRIEIVVEGFRFALGPFMDISNKLMLTYSMIDWSTGQAITGLKGVTPWVTDAASITKYGIQSKVLSTGGIQIDLIDELLNLTLIKLHQPARSEDVSFGTQATAFDIRIDLLGWGSMLEKYPYNSSSTSPVNISTKISNIVTAEPNSLFSTQGIQVNTLQVFPWENDNATAWGLIKNAITLGDASNNRWLFGIYENRVARYALAAETIGYMRPLGENLLTVLDTSGNEVPGWQVRPGTWVQISDLIPSKKNREIDPFDDLQRMFIESVSFRSPDSLVLNGSQTFKLDQRLAQLGISGIGL